MPVRRSKTLTQSGFDHVLLPLACFVVFALIGSFYLYHSLAATSTQWKGVLELSRLNSGYCLTTTGSTKASLVELDPCSKTYDSKQVWDIVDIRQATVSTETDVQEFYIQSADGGECIDDWGASKVSSYPEKLYPCSTTDSALTWLWGAKFTSRGYSAHQLSNLATASLCLDDRNDATTSGTYVGLYTCKTSAQANQEWIEQGAPGSSGSGTGTSGGTAPKLPGGLSGTLVSNMTGAQLYSSSAWSKSYPGSGKDGINPSSGCFGDSGTITVSDTDLDLKTNASPSWNCAGIESTSAYSPGHIFQLYEYIPAAANGNIADYPSWWLTDAAWNFEIDAAEAHAWGTTSPIDGQMCFDIHNQQGAQNTSPNCMTLKGGWHTFTLDWASNGDVTMWYDGTKMNPNPQLPVTGNENMIIWNDNNGGSGTVTSTLKVGYLAEWNL